MRMLNWAVKACGNFLLLMAGLAGFGMAYVVLSSGWTQDMPAMFVGLVVCASCGMALVKLAD